MAKDYAKRSSQYRKRKHRGNNRTKRSNQGGSSGALWLLTGVLAGLLISGLVYLKGHEPKSVATINNQPTVLVKRDLHHQQTRLNENVKAHAARIEPKFDFYTILPKMKVWVPNNKNDDNQQTTPANVENNPANVPPTNPKSDTAATAPNPPPVSPSVSQNSSAKAVSSNSNADKKEIASTEVYRLQVASFDTFKEADELKAQLILQGFAASISSASSHNKTINRVWIGPYSSLAQASKIQKDLRQQNIPAILVKNDG